MEGLMEAADLRNKTITELVYGHLIFLLKLIKLQLRYLIPSKEIVFAEFSNSGVFTW